MSELVVLVHLTMKLLLADLVLLLAICGRVHSAETQWTLVDNYDFDETTTEQLRSDPNWEIDDEPENLCQGENIFQYSCHRMSNVAVRDGKLEILADVNGNSGNSRFLFNTGKLSSNKTWTYGKFEMHAMMPEGKLLRAVFVLKPKYKIYPGNSWLDNGQINGLVYSQQGDAISAGLHYRMDLSHSYAGRKLATKQNLTTTFHTYSLEWTNSSIRFYFDSVLFYDHAVSKPFDQPFYFSVQLGVGGPEFDTRNLAVQPSDAAQWRNNRFVIDYIKVFKEAPMAAVVPQNPIEPTDSSGPSSSVSALGTLPFIVMAAVLLFIPLFNYQ